MFSTNTFTVQIIFGQILGEENNDTGAEFRADLFCGVFTCVKIILLQIHVEIR